MIRRTARLVLCLAAAVLFWTAATTAASADDGPAAVQAMPDAGAHAGEPCDPEAHDLSALHCGGLHAGSYGVVGSQGIAAGPGSAPVPALSAPRPLLGIDVPPDARPPNRA